MAARAAKVSMPTSATGTRSKPKTVAIMRQVHRGFTLIELLVAVVIVAIILSVTVLSVGLVGDDREVQTEARRLMSLLELSQDEAMMQGREFGIEFLRQGYRFVEYDPVANLWVEQIEDETFRYRPMPEGVEIELWLEDRPVALEIEPVILERPEEDDAEDEDNDRDERQFGRDEYAPHLLIYSSGDMTAFELRLVRQFDRATIAMGGDLLGNIDCIDLDDEYLRNCTAALGRLHADRAPCRAPDSVDRAAKYEPHDGWHAQQCDNGARANLRKLDRAEQDRRVPPCERDPRGWHQFG